jgi:DNA-binding transcriptional MocR family regulator
LRQKLEIQQGRMLATIARNFPPGTRVSKPTGGYYLWVEMEHKVNTMDLYRLAKEKNITIAPGPMFSPRRKFANCMRLNYGRLCHPA